MSANMTPPLFDVIAWRAGTRCRTVLAFMPIPMSQIPADLLTRGNMNESCHSGLQVIHESNPVLVIAEVIATLKEKKKKKMKRPH